MEGIFVHAENIYGNHHLPFMSTHLPKRMVLCSNPNIYCKENDEKTTKKNTYFLALLEN